MAERLVFTHVGKAAGSTINGALYTVMAQCGANTLAFSGASTTYADASLPLSLLHKHQLDLDDFPIVTGHIPFATARRCFAPATFVTVLRDPASLLLSNYSSQPWNRKRHDFGLGAFEGTLRWPWRISRALVPYRPEWCIDNSQTRMLCDAPRFGQPAVPEMLEQAMRNLEHHYAVVGFQNQLGAFLKALGDLYGLNLTSMVEKNLNPTGNYREHATDRHWEIARRYSPLDAELVRWARDRFAGRSPGRQLAVPAPNASFIKYAIGPDRFELAL